jgi:hypothetical protein
MPDPLLASKIARAQEAYSRLVDYMRNRGWGAIVPLLDPIERALVSGDPEEIQRQREARSTTDDDLLEATFRDLELRVRFGIMDDALASIKLFHRRRVDRPPVDISDDAVARRIKKIQQLAAKERPWWQRLFSRGASGSGS